MRSSEPPTGEKNFHMTTSTLKSAAQRVSVGGR
jgi:hypothetical protein